MNLVKAGRHETALIRKLAIQIWWESYIGILSDAQIEFMLNDIYSENALQLQMTNGADFNLIYHNDLLCGFISFEEKPRKILRIHKLYLTNSCKGLGIGKAVILYLENYALQMNLKTLELNVNRENPAYSFYLKQGFTVIQEVDLPYHQFILNDYIMQKEI